MLDHLSGGRLVLGLGIGHQEPDFAAYGADHARRAAALDEALDVLERAFSGEPFEHEGRVWRLRAAGITPRPRTLPRPELWLGGHSASGLRRAARRADRWLADPQRDVATLERLAERYREECEGAGTVPRVALFREAWIADDREQVEREWMPHALAVHRLYVNVGAYRPALEPWLREVREREDLTAERLAPGRFLVGSGDEVRAEAEDWCRRTGADYLAVRLRHPGGPPHERVLDAIARFGDEVVSPLE